MLFVYVIQLYSTKDKINFNNFDFDQIKTWREKSTTFHMLNKMLWIYGGVGKYFQYIYLNRFTFNKRFDFNYFMWRNSLKLLCFLFKNSFANNKNRKEVYNFFLISIKHKRFCKIRFKTLNNRPKILSVLKRSFVFLNNYKLFQFKVSFICLFWLWR